MRFNTEKYIIYGLLVGMILGGLVGVILGPNAAKFGFLGDLFLNALKMIIVPLIIFSMISGVTALGNVRKLGRLGAATVVYYLVTTGLAVILGIIIVNIIQPGTGFTPESLPRGQGSTAGQFSFLDVILNMFPPNLVQAMAETNVMPLIVFSLLLGSVLTTLGGRAKQVIEIINVLNDAILKIVRFIMLFAPIGVFGLVAGKLGAEGGGAAFWVELVKLSRYMLAVIVGLIIHGTVILPLLLYLFAKRSPFDYFRKVGQALATAFSTASSSATLPVTLESVEYNAGVSNKTASFVLPLGATINMDGTALYEAVAAIFIAQLYGIHLTFGAQVTIVFTATLASIGAAGIPQAGLVTMVIVLQAVNLPTEGIGTILAVDWFLDRCRTTVNVWGDTVGSAVIDNRLYGSEQVSETQPV
jgi:Na+/H+-dicarboxylate symporter